ncbi:hypothetical protein Vretifemale_8290 [Volvox reticuliferus]|uniref:Uncharacterized protein n=1 Tax=Volvox reticuliferus TaxID=1737510 RepID=A0A8J4CC73_9CHLO|nr:hypothetical protein Vretifemale_8290 [Volvox reticuliferus]
MLQALLLDSAIGSRVAGGSLVGVLPNLLRVVLRLHVSTQPCRTITTLNDASPHAIDEVSEASCPSCSASGYGDYEDFITSTRGGLDTGPRWSGLLHRLPVLQLQQQHYRGISTTSTISYKFDSHLTRYNKARVVNKDNFQRFRDSGRDARVAADILHEGERSHRRDGRWGRSEADKALLELRSMVHDCRDLRSMQVLVRECAGDMDSFLVCSVLGRLPQLKQDTPAAVGPEALARRVADALMKRLEALAATTSPGNLAHAMIGLANCGFLPPRPLLAAVVARLSADGQRGGTVAADADAKAVSKLLSAIAKFLDLVKIQGLQGPPSPLPEKVEAGGDGRHGEDVSEGGIGDVLRKQLWPVLREAAEVKLLRALGEEPTSGRAAGAAQRRASGATEEDDSMPQTALRFICIALAMVRETHPGTWTAAARLTARHAGELQPAAAAGVARSYAVAGGAALDGGEAKLFEAVWGALGPQVEGLDVQVQLDLLIAALKLAAAAAQAVPVLCSLLALRVPALSVSDASHLIIALAELHTKSVAEASDAAAAAAGGSAAASGDAATAASAVQWQKHSYGVLPRLLGDLLILRGFESFGAARFASATLALGLLGHADPAFWQQLAAAALPEVPRMDSTTLSRLMGAFLTAALAAEAPLATVGTAASAAAAAASIPAPSPALVSAAHARVRMLLSGGGELSGKPLFHMVRALAEWPLPEDRGAAVLSTLADRLLADGAGAAEVAAAPPKVRQRLTVALRRAGLGEHGLVARLAVKEQ